MATGLRVGPMPGTDEWQRLRLYDPETGSVVFGASEAAAAVGMSRYCTPLELYLRKTGRLDNDLSDNEAVEMGHLLEPVVLTLYERRTGRTLQRNHPFYFHPEHEFMGCTPDATTPTEDGGVAVDAKTSNWRMLDHASDDKWGEGGDAVPTEYLFQAQQQAAVLGLQRVDFPVLFDGRQLRIYSVPRDEELIEHIVAAERELAERIKNDDPPEPTWTHKNTARCLRALHGLQHETVQLSQTAAELWSMIAERKKAITELEMLIEADKNRVLAELGAAEVGVFPCGTKELRRVVVAESRYTTDDVAELRMKVGEIKRRGYERLTEKKVKK